MNDLESGLLMVLAYFLGIILFIYICFKIYEIVKSRKSRHYRNVLPEGQGVLETRGDYVLVNAPPIRPNYFPRSYKYKSQEYEPTGEQDDEHKHEGESTKSVVTVEMENELDTKTTSV